MEVHKEPEWAEGSVASVHSTTAEKHIETGSQTLLLVPQPSNDSRDPLVRAYWIKNPT